MGFYREQIVPHLVNLAMRNADLLPYRERVVSAAEGRVLEIGVGAGPNLRWYSARVKEIVALEPSAKLIAMARRAAPPAGNGSPAAIGFVKGSAEEIPLESRSVDSVVMTWTLCSIADASRALGEMRRVLRPGGRLLFVEHGQSPDAKVRKWQDRLTPPWKCLAGGCHLNRPIPTLIESSGFRVTNLKTGYLQRGPKPMTFLYEGCASAD